MLADIEEVATEAELLFLSHQNEWTCSTDHPHVSAFKYDVEAWAGDAAEERTELERTPFGSVSGYRIAQDWTVASDLDLWKEADSMDDDAVGYVESLVRELRSCELVLESSISLTMLQRVTIIRHWEPAEGVDPNSSIQAVVASLAMMDAPVVMLVDPWTFAEERDSAEGKLKGRGHISRLLPLGFHRMVGSRFVWAWNRQLADGVLANYSYEALVQARQLGVLDQALGFPMIHEVYGDLGRDSVRPSSSPPPKTPKHE